jgi:UDP-N-acetylglucosamine 2-epimerase (non-hydrolysing)
MTLAGTRPELIKLSETIKAADADARFEHVFVHAGQNRDPALHDAIIADLGLRAPDHQLDMTAEAPARAVARVIDQADRLIEAVRPDACLILGDTNAALCAYAAKRRRTPIFHMEAGNRCFDPRVPEEINRRLVDHLADLNLPYTRHARDNLLAEGFPDARIVVTGSPMGEVLDAHAAAIAKAEERLSERSPGGHLLVSAHREETVDDPVALRALVDALDALADRFGLPILVTGHPRLRLRLDGAGLSPASPLVTIASPFGFHDWIALQKTAACVISDSGTLSEEAALLGFPAVMIRDRHERPEGEEAHVFTRAALSPLTLPAVVADVMAGRRPAPTMPADYRPRDVSARVLDLIAAWTPRIAASIALGRS